MKKVNDDDIRGNETAGVNASEPEVVGQPNNRRGGEARREDSTSSKPF